MMQKSSTSPDHGPPTAPRWLKWGWATAAVAATLGVFALYQRPDFLLTLADQLWSCF